MASNSKVSICNKALSALGNGTEIQNLESEKSEEARACRVFFDEAVEDTLRDFSWPFARRFATLALVSDTTIAGWKYTYRYPSNCAALRRLVPANGMMTERVEEKIPHLIGSDSSGRVIYTNEADAICEYTHNIVNPALFPSDFAVAVAYRLAYHIAPRVTGGDPFKNQDKAEKAYEGLIRKARTNALREERDPLPPEGELVAVRK